MSHRKLTPSQKRILAYRSVLEVVAQRNLPWVCDDPTEIEALLALHGAALIVADFEPPITARDGSKHIPRVVIKGLTIDGRKALRDIESSPTRVGALPIRLLADQP